MSPNPPSAPGGPGAARPSPTPPFLAVILAGGLGTRMRSRVPKVLHRLCGRPMLAYVIDAAEEASRSRPLVVYSPATAAVCEEFAGRADFVLQEEPRGTGDALRAALAAIPPGTAEIVVLSGDTPLVRPETARAVAERRRADGAAMTLATFRPPDPRAYGSVVRDGGEVVTIVERKDAAPEDLATGEFNAGLYAFDADWLRGSVPRLVPSVATGELYLTALVAIARADGARVSAHELEDAGESLGVDDRVQLAAASGELRRRILERLLLSGVTLEDPGSTYVDATVELAEDVTLEANVVLRGATRVGRDTVIGAGTQILDSVIGERCRVWASVLEESEIEDDVRIGPYTHLRPGSSIGRGARLGNFAEVKNSRLGPGVQQHHFSYLGDAEVGAGSNIGAGTVTANWDGTRKLRTTIGERAFLGVDTMLVAPIEIGDGAKTGAGAVVTHDVPPGKLVFGVPARIREPRDGAAEEQGS